MQCKPVVRAWLAVDVALHGHGACSSDAVLPLQRWIPLTAAPVLDTLELLLHGGILPQIEKTALQFPRIQEVLRWPPEVFQP